MSRETFQTQKVNSIMSHLTWWSKGWPLFRLMNSGRRELSTRMQQLERWRRSLKVFIQFICSCSMTWNLIKLIKTEKMLSLKFKKSKRNYNRKIFHTLTATFKPTIWINWSITSKIQSKFWPNSCLMLAKIWNSKRSITGNKCKALTKTKLRLSKSKSKRRISTS